MLYVYAILKMTFGHPGMAYFMQILVPVCCDVVTPRCFVHSWFSGAVPRICFAPKIWLFLGWQYFCINSPPFDVIQTVRFISRCIRVVCGRASTAETSAKYPKCMTSRSVIDRCFDHNTSLSPNRSVGTLLVISSPKFLCNSPLLFHRW